MRRPYTWILEPPQQAFKKDPSGWTPVLKVRVGAKHQKTPRFGAIVDSGSPWCMFKSDVGEYLGIDVKSGKSSTIGGISEGMEEPIYFHKVQVWVEDNHLIEVTAGFVKKLRFAGILGRDGFFDNFLVKFDHTKNPPEFEIDKIPAIQ